MQGLLTKRPRVEGKEVTGLSVTWDTTYIYHLGPYCYRLWFGVQVFDPEQLFGEQT